MRISLLIVGLSVTLPVAAHGQAARFEQGDLVLSDGSNHIRIAELSDPPGETPHKAWVHCVKKVGADYYVLVTTSAYTRGYPPKGGFGGGGEEYYLIWLHIAGGRVAERNEHRYRSFIQNREGRIDGWRGSVFTATTEGDAEGDAEDSAGARQTITFTFDARHPEAGIKEERAQPKPTSFHATSTTLLASSSAAAGSQSRRSDSIFRLRF